MSDIVLEPQVMSYIRKCSLDTVEGAFKFGRGEDLVKPGLGRRRRTRLYFCDTEKRCWEMYLKRYASPGLKEKLIRFFTGRRKWSEAGCEFANVREIRQAGVPTMREVVWGADADWLGTGRNYIIVTAVPGDALERIGEDFIARNQGQPEKLSELTEQLIQLVSRFHASGFVHRDLYAAHIFLYEHDGLMELNLIDLARAFKPKRRQFRWRVKDLAQLKFSMPTVWVEQCWDRFMRGYLGLDNIAEGQRWGKAIDAKVALMQRQQKRRAARKARKGQA